MVYNEEKGLFQKVMKEAGEDGEKVLPDMT